MKWQIGDVEIIQVVEMEGGELIQEFTPLATPENVKKIKWLFPHFADKNGKLKALVQSFLIKSNGKNILVDSCNGNNKSRPSCPAWGNLDTNYLEKLREIRVNESDIDFVISTHFHFDHVGWNTKLEDRKFVPTFPNAKYLLVEDEYNYWSTSPEKELQDDRLGFEDSVAPVVAAGLDQIVKSDHQIDNNIRLIPTPGHTPGHVAIQVKSKGKKALISGDFLHHPCQFTHPDWMIASDTYPEVALKTRLNMLEELVDSETLFIGSHFANPVAGYIERSDKSFTFNTSRAR